MILGCDYAAVDGNAKPDFAAARGAGLRFAVVRAAYGIEPDPTCARDRDAIRAAGLVFGAYLFLVAELSAPHPEQQVRAAVRAAGLIPGRDLPLAIDVEFPRVLSGTDRSRGELGAWIGRAVTAARTETGADPIVYSSARVLSGTDTDALAGEADEVIRGLPLWLARYPFKTRIPSVTGGQAAALPPPPVPRVAGDADDWWIHQYQGDALGLPGFTRTVDLNRWNPLRRGARGARVARVQRQLGMAEGTPAVWDDAMDAAVREFQSRHGLEPDAIIGPATFAALSVKCVA